MLLVSPCHEYMLATRGHWTVLNFFYPFCQNFHWRLWVLGYGVFEHPLRWTSQRRGKRWWERWRQRWAAIMMRCSRHPHLTTAPGRVDAFCKGEKRTPGWHTTAIRAPVISRALGDLDLCLGGLHLSGGPPLSSQLGSDVFFCSFVSCASSTSCSEYLRTAYEIGLIMTHTWL